MIRSRRPGTGPAAGGGAPLMVRAIALALTVLTGFSGLVYEVTWQKCFATLLGSHSEATAAVLAIFLGGLSAGYALFGRWVRRWVAGATPLLVVYGVVEAAIGIHALVFPWLFEGARRLSLAVPLESQPAAFAFDVLLTAALIGPPTVLMGGTIPILTQGLSHGVRDATRVHAWVYGFNTAGAFVGALAAGFFLVAELGIPGTLRAMGALNLAAGAIFGWLGMRVRSSARPAVEPSPEVRPVIAGYWRFAAAAALLGFAMMAIQTALIRIAGLALGASHFTFATIVAVFVLCIALGSLVVSALPRIPAAAAVACPWLLAVLLIVLYPLLDDAPYWAHRLRILFGPSEADFWPHAMAVFAAFLGVLALPVGLSGATLPLLFHQLRGTVGDLGHVAGRLYSWNTLGSLAGALLGGYALLLWLDLHWVYRLAVLAILLAGALLAPPLLPDRSRRALGLVAVAMAAVVALPAWAPGRLSAGYFRYRQPTVWSRQGPNVLYRNLHGQEDFVFYADDPVASIAVFESELFGQPNLTLMNNGKSDGSLVGDYATMSLVVLIPCLFAGKCENAFVIGYGMGVTAGEFASLETARQAVVAEISSAVLEAAPLFDHGNRRASESPVVRTVRSDAYRALLRSEDRFDVIASEPSNPWMTGVEMLFSREFLEAARDRLAPGGVYAQWFHAYETDEAVVEMILKTYTEVFDRVAVWFTLGHDHLLLGFRDGPEEPSLDEVRRRFERPDFRAGFQRAGISSLAGLLAHELLPLGSLDPALLEGDVHTLLHPRLSDRAARAFFRGGRGGLPWRLRVGAAEAASEGSLLRAWLDRLEGDELERARRDVAEQFCESRLAECANWLGWWRAEAPSSRVRQRTGAAVLRRSILTATRGGPKAADLELLSQLHRTPASDAGAPVKLATARRASTFFRRFFQPTVPMRADALRSIWERCDAESCSASREAALAALDRWTEPPSP